MNIFCIKHFAEEPYINHGFAVSIEEIRQTVIQFITACKLSGIMHKYYSTAVLIINVERHIYGINLIFKSCCFTNVNSTYRRTVFGILRKNRHFNRIHALCSNSTPIAVSKKRFCRHVGTDIICNINRCGHAKYI